MRHQSPPHPPPLPAAHEHTPLALVQSLLLTCPGRNLPQILAFLPDQSGYAAVVDRLPSEEKMREIQDLFLSVMNLTLQFYEPKNLPAAIATHLHSPGLPVPDPKNIIFETLVALYMTIISDLKGDIAAGRKLNTDADLAAILDCSERSSLHLVRTEASFTPEFLNAERHRALLQVMGSHLYVLRNADWELLSKAPSSSTRYLHALTKDDVLLRDLSTANAAGDIVQTLEKNRKIKGRCDLKHILQSPEIALRILAELTAFREHVQHEKSKLAPDTLPQLIEHALEPLEGCDLTEAFRIVESIRKKISHSSGRSKKTSNDPESLQGSAALSEDMLCQLLSACGLQATKLKSSSASIGAMTKISPLPIVSEDSGGITLPLFETIDRLLQIVPRLDLLPGKITASPRCFGIFDSDRGFLEQGLSAYTVFRTVARLKSVYAREKEVSLGDLQNDFPGARLVTFSVKGDVLTASWAKTSNGYQLSRDTVQGPNLWVTSVAGGLLWVKRIRAGLGKMRDE